MPIKCTDCGTEVPERKQERELKIEFTNPGTVFLNAEVMECPKCKSTYCDEDGAEEFFNKVEEEYNLKNKK